MLKRALLALALVAAAILPAYAQKGTTIGGATASTPFIATGGSTASSDVSRASYSGTRLDFKQDFGAACDGVTDDTSALNSVITAYGATTSPVTITVAAICIIDAGTYTMSGNLSFEGLGDNGGFRIKASSTISANLFVWSGGPTAVSIKNLVLDLNSAAIATGGLYGAFYFAPGIDLNFEHDRVINAGTIATGGGLLELEAYGMTHGLVTNSTFSFNAAQNAQNQCMNIGETTFPSTDIVIQGNTCINTSIGVFGTGNTNFVINNNIINGWGFGAGIAFEIVTSNDTATKVSTIANNVITNSLVSQDVNGTNLDGIEVGYNGVVVNGNSISKTCGPGIAFYGKVSVTDNTISDTGLCNTSYYYNAGIVAAAPGGLTNSGSGSYLNGNTVYDDGGGHTSYGYTDIAAVVAVTLGSNNFNGLLGAYNINGVASFADAQDDNRVVNPCVQFDQRNEGATVNTNGALSADQWRLGTSHNYMTINEAVSAMGQCLNGMLAGVSSQQTPATGDFLFFYQDIGLNDVKDFNYATANAQNGILAFCVKLSIAPPFTGSFFLQNHNANYSYVNNFTVSALANTRQCFSYRVPADTAHSLGLTGTNIAFVLGFDLGSGATEATSILGSWVSGSFYRSTTASSFVSQSAGATMTVSDVRFLPASADNGWAPRTYGAELQNAQRFYRKSFPQGTKPAQNTGSVVGSICTKNPIAAGEPSQYVAFAPLMWANPTITTFNPSAANANWRDVTAGADVTIAVDPATALSTDGVLIGTGASVATLGDILCAHYTADAGL